MSSIEEIKGLITQSGGVAMSNYFRVDLPPVPNSPLATSQLNLLCTSTQLPGLQIMTHDKVYGSFHQKIAYGRIQDDISLTFHVLNDYGIKKYFEQWQSLAVNKDTYEAGYVLGPNGYGKNVKIHQLKKGIGLPIYTDNIFDIDLITKDQVVYSVELQEAFPVTVNSIDLSDATTNDSVKLTVQLTYRKWKSL